MTRTGILVASTNRGRYAIDYARGVDVNAGARLMVLLGSHWISGTVEHGQVYSGEDGIERGYYFIADSGECCGLCGYAGASLLECEVEDAGNKTRYGATVVVDDLSGSKINEFGSYKSL